LKEIPDVLINNFLKEIPDVLINNFFERDSGNFKNKKRYDTIMGGGRGHKLVIKKSIKRRKKEVKYIYHDM
jgi:hypothetical protein